MLKNNCLFRVIFIYQLIITCNIQANHIAVKKLLIHKFVVNPLKFANESKFPMKVMNGYLGIKESIVIVVYKCTNDTHT